MSQRSLSSSSEHGHYQGDKINYADAVRIAIDHADTVHIVEIPPESIDGAPVDRISIYSIAEPRWSRLWQRLRDRILPRHRMDSKPIDEAHFYRRYALKVTAVDSKDRKAEIIVHHTNDADVLQYILNRSSGNVIGMDTETSPKSIWSDQTLLVRRVPPDLVQLAIGNDIVLVHVPRSNCPTKRRLVAVLNRYLGDGKRVVAGVNIENDIAGIRHFPIPNPITVMDSAKATKLLLKRMAQVDSPSRWNSLTRRGSLLKSETLSMWLQRLLTDKFGLSLERLDVFLQHDGLKELTLFLLDVHLPKQPKHSPPIEFTVTHGTVSDIQRRQTSWDRIDLDSLQIAYAALDAWASRETLTRLKDIYDACALLHKSPKEDPMPFFDFMSDA
jgi:hypothetical protein